MGSAGVAARMSGQRDKKAGAKIPRFRLHFQHDLSRGRRAQWTSEQKQAFGPMLKSGWPRCARGAGGQADQSDRHGTATQVDTAGR